jgi:hypothetical protein
MVSCSVLICCFRLKKNSFLYSNYITALRNISLDSNPELTTTMHCVLHVLTSLFATPEVMSALPVAISGGRNTSYPVRVRNLIISVSRSPRPLVGAQTEADQAKAKPPVVPVPNEDICGSGGIAPRIPNLRSRLRCVQFHTPARVKYERQWPPGPSG